MADYKSAYTGAQIDGAVAGVTTNANNITALTTRVSTLEGKGLNVSGSGSRIIKLGGLIIQMIPITLAFCNVETRSFPEAFPNECIFVGIQGYQCGASGQDGYWGYPSIQTVIVSKTQYRTFLNSSANGATMAARVIAIGY